MISNNRILDQPETVRNLLLSKSSKNVRDTHMDILKATKKATATTRATKTQWTSWILNLKNRPACSKHVSSHWISKVQNDDASNQIRESQFPFGYGLT